MDMLNWEAEKEEREKISKEKHARLSRLFMENRFAFELERKKMINGLIDSVEDTAQREKLLELQEAWDRRMKGAGNNHNRFVLAKAFFWDHFHNNWFPTLQQISSSINRNPEMGDS